MTTNNTISIIIPVYNSEKYLKESLSSIFNDIKDDSNIEVITVLNGCNDNSELIIKKEQLIHNNLIMTYSDKGVSNARNKGISISKGDYIIFFDADDIWLPGSIKKIYDDLSTNKDLYIYSFIKGKKNASINNCQKIIHTTKLISISSIIKWIISKPTLRAQAWAKLYKKSIIINNNIMFNKNLKYSEDSEFVLRYLKYVKDISVFSFPIYKYVLSENSTMRKESSERIEQYIYSMKCTIKEYKNNSEYYNAINKYVATHFNIILVHDVFVFGNKFHDSMKKYKQLLKEKIFIDSIKNIKLSECLCKELLVEFCIKLHLNVLVALLCFSKSYLNSR